MVFSLTGFVCFLYVSVYVLVLCIRYVLLVVVVLLDGSSSNGKAENEAHAHCCPSISAMIYSLFLFSVLSQSVMKPILWHIYITAYINQYNEKIGIFNEMFSDKNVK